MGYKDKSLQVDIITLDELTADLVHLICELYWLDFYCLDMSYPSVECEAIVQQQADRFGSPGY